METGGAKEKIVSKMLPVLFVTRDRLSLCSSSHHTAVCTFCSSVGMCSSLGMDVPVCSPAWLLVPGYSASCPIAGVLPPYDINSSGFPGIFSLVTSIIAPFLLIASSVHAWRNVPEAGRAIKKSEQIVKDQLTQAEDASSPMPPIGTSTAYRASCFGGMVTVNVNSTENRMLVPLILFLLAYMFVAMGPVIGLSSFYSTPVTQEMKIALQGVANPSSEIDAGYLGFKGLNMRDGSTSYDCGLLPTGGSDQRACYVLKAISAFTLIYTIFIFMLSVPAFCWAVRIVWLHHVREKHFNLRTPVTFPPHLYMLVKLASNCLSAILFTFGFAGKYALETGVLIPHANWSIGDCTYICILIMVHNNLLQFLLWNTIESCPPIAPLMHETGGNFMPQRSEGSPGRSSPTSQLNRKQELYSVLEQ
jgi:hypothetical protein